MRLVIFGLGYTCAHYVRSRKLAASVTGTTRRSENAVHLRHEGMRTLLFDESRFDEQIAPAIAACDAIIVSAPPGEAGDPVLRRFSDGLRAAERLGRIIYLSTIGVYGDHSGGWVDETTPPRAEMARSRTRLHAEADWLRLGEETGKRVHILRLAGIYGPARNALTGVAEGAAKRIVKPGQIFNRIHVEDIARAIDACLSTPTDSGVWNVSDDLPCPGPEVIEYAASLLGLPAPPEVAFEAADLSPMARSFYGESRRVSNHRLRSELGVELAYPTYREGLRALFQQGEGRAKTDPITRRDWPR